MGREKFSNTYIRDNKNRKRKNAAVKEASIKRMGESRINREQRYGKYPELINKGEQDRITNSKPLKFQEESMQLSYSYGYYEKASKLLEGLFSKGIFNEEEQRNFGINDIINEIPEKYIKNIKKYPSYLEGRLYQLGKKTYDFIYENELSFEEYINILSIIQPEVNTTAFKEGYISREIEKNEKKQK